MRSPLLSTSQFVEKNRHYFPTAAIALSLCILLFYVSGFFCGVKAPLDLPSTDHSGPLFGRGAGGPGRQQRQQQPFRSCRLELNDITPCMDPNRWGKFPQYNSIFRERHCPSRNERERCLVPPVRGYKIPIRWPESLQQSWYDNVPYDWINKEKAGQHWMERDGEKWIFSGGGTMFADGADKYLDELENVLPPLKDGTIRTALDTGCGVASWGGYLYKRGVLVMSLAPRDNHEAQVQFALERGIPAMLGVLSTHRLPYPSCAFDMAHCSRCLIPWKANGGQNLLEIARVLRPGGFWVLSGPPVNWQRRWRGWNQTEEELKGEMDELSDLLKGMCFSEYKIEGDFAIWQKSSDNSCLKNRARSATPPVCVDDESLDSAWYVPMKSCITPLPDDSSLNVKLQPWPARINAVPPRIRQLHGSLSDTAFESDSNMWVQRVEQYKNLVPKLHTGGIRNVMDMYASYGGFAAALVNYPVWVMNVVSPFTVDTLGIVFERGLIGSYNDWCEAFSTYPRTYDLLHAAGLFSAESHRCENEDVLIEMDRILRPNGVVIFRDLDYVVNELAKKAALVRWNCQTHQPDDFEKTGNHAHEPPDLILICIKQFWTL